MPSVPLSATPTPPTPTERLGRVNCSSSSTSPPAIRSGSSMNTGNWIALGRRLLGPLSFSGSSGWMDWTRDEENIQVNRTRSGVQVLRCPNQRNGTLVVSAFPPNSRYSLTITITIHRFHDSSDSCAVVRLRRGFKLDVSQTH